MQAVFWIGLFLRVFYITVGHRYLITDIQDHFNFGYEMGRVARALVTGHGYANPFNGLTGPTAWVPPLYPLLIAGVFKVFGVYTATLRVDAADTEQRLFGGHIGLHLSHRQSLLRPQGRALVGVDMGALPRRHAVRRALDMGDVAELHAAHRGHRAGGQDARRWHESPDPRQPSTRQTTKQWLLFGALWGLIGLSNSALLILLPACGIWVLLGSPTRAVWLRAIASGLVFIAWSRHG